jgi:hypothetical protein
MSYDPERFVNREDQLAAFQTCLQGTGDRPVLLFYGPQGAGKTSMLNHLRRFCRTETRTCTLVDLWHDSLFEAEEIIEFLCRRIPALGEAMEPRRKALEQAWGEQLATGSVPSGQSGDDTTVPAGPAPASTFEVRTGDIGAGAVVVIGQGNSINNSQLYPAPEQAPARIRKQWLHDLSRVFREELRQLADRELVVLLFDSCDQTTPEARKWMWNELFDPLLYGSLAFPPNLVIAVAGDRACKEGIWLDEMIRRGEGVEAQELGELPRKAVRKYWTEIRGLDEALLQQVFPPGGALPLVMVNMANIWKEASR